MHLSMAYTEVRRLPVRYRTWFIKRLSDYYDKKNENMSANTQPKQSDVTSLGEYEQMLDKKFK